MASANVQKNQAYDLLVEADAILKVVQFSDIPNDPENAIVNCSLAAASRLLNQAMHLVGE